MHTKTRIKARHGKANVATATSRKARDVSASQALEQSHTLESK